MKIKKLVGSVFLAMGVFLLTACGSSNSQEKMEQEGNVSNSGNTIGLSVSTLNNPFFISLVDGAKEKAEEYNLDLIVVDARDDVAKQTNDIEDLISKNISVLIVNPVDSDACAPVVQEAISKGIKVVSVDRVVNGVEVDSSISSDNVEGAKKATEHILSLVGKDAKVAELEGIPGASATIDRGEGFHIIADKELNVVAKQTANFSRSEGLSVMENILQANPDIKAVFAHNDEMALGAVEAIGDKEILVVGFDATEDALTAIKDGKMSATVAQKPDLMGMTSIEIANKLITGEEVEKNIHVEVELVTE